MYQFMIPVTLTGESFKYFNRDWELVKLETTEHF